MTGHNYAISEVSTDQTNMSERERGIECSSNKCSSSYDDSSSIGQVDFAPESDQKLSNEFTQPESSHQQVFLYPPTPFGGHFFLPFIVRSC